MRSAVIVGTLVVLTGVSGCGRSEAPKTATASAPTPAPAATSAPAAAPAVDGEAVYTANCATCHMADGRGVPNFQPPIVGSTVLAADPVRLETVIRAGSAALKDRPNPMGWEMPPFGYLTDPEIKALVAYVRGTFGAGE